MRNIGGTPINQTCWVVPTMYIWIFYYIVLQQNIFSNKHLKEYCSQLPVQRSIFVPLSTYCVLKLECHDKFYFYVCVFEWGFTVQYCWKTKNALQCIWTGFFFSFKTNNRIPWKWTLFNYFPLEASLSTDHAFANCKAIALLGPSYLAPGVYCMAP